MNDATALERLRAELAAAIIKTLDEEGLSTRAAQQCAGIAAADFSRIRTGKLAGFTVDRLCTILDRLGRQVTFSIDVRPRREDGQRELHLPAA